MAVVIRMKRTGRRNRPCYRISVADSRSPRDGRTLETLGLYDPVCADKEAQAKVDQERARYWLSMGARPSETVESLFKRLGVYEGMDRRKKVVKRKGRGKATAKRKRRIAEKARRTGAKEARRTVRDESRRAAKKAAAAAEGASEE